MEDVIDLEIGQLCLEVSLQQQRKKKAFKYPSSGIRDMDLYIQICAQIVRHTLIDYQK